MFVRNNTSCPNCGKSRTFDLFVRPPFGGSACTITAECYECMAFSSKEVPYTVVRYVLQGIAELCPRAPGSQIWRNWDRGNVCRFLTKRQVVSVQEAAFLFFSEGEVSSAVLESEIPQVSLLVGWLLDIPSSVSRYQSLLGLFPGACAGQPLAS